MSTMRSRMRYAARGMTGALPLLAAALGLGACVDDYTALELSRPETRHQINYSSRAEALLVEVPPGAHGLSFNQEADVIQFLARYKVESSGQLRLSTPYGTREHAAANQSLREIRELAREHGVAPGNIVVGRHAAPARGGNAVKVAYDKPVAIPPACADWSEDAGRTRERLHYPQFGCATQRNLALNVANARDLQRPQDEQDGSSERMGVNWTKYVYAGAAAGNAGASQPAVGSDSKPGKPMRN